MAEEKLSLTSIRFSDEDRKILDRLCKLAGLDSASAAVRLAIRESVATREQQRRRESKRFEMGQDLSLPEWWEAILAADAKDVANADAPRIPRTVMHCVFCRRDLRGLLMESAASPGARMKGGGHSWPSSAM